MEQWRLGRIAGAPGARLAALLALMVLAVAIGVAPALAGGGQRGTPRTSATPTIAPTAIAPDVVERAAKLKYLDMSKSPLEAGLVAWELAVVDKLKQAAVYMDQAYWQQVDPDGLPIFDSLAGATSEPQKSARKMMDANYGVWDRFDNFAPFIGAQARPLGAYVFPTDLTEAELNTYIAAHPDEKAQLLDPYTVVRRSGDALITVPYHEVYAAYVEPAADLLDEAAALSENASLTTFLKLQAQGLRTDEYFDADMAWLDLDANLDVSIGPFETYDDQLTGQKAFYKANVLIVDKSAAAKLDTFKAAVPDLQKNLPVPAEYRPDQTGTMTPMELADDVRRSGQGRAVMEPVAFSLPNDPKVWAAKGSKKVMMGNYLQARRTTVLVPLSKVVMAPKAVKSMVYQTYFDWVLMHEISHTLGPRTVTQNGQVVTVRQALGESYTPIEEGKADIGGLYNIPYLQGTGVITGSLRSHYMGYLSDALRSIRFGQGSAYGVIRLAAWNFFVEKGGLTYDRAGRHYDLNMAEMTPAVKDLLIQLVTIEGEGDAAAAKAFIAKYSVIAPQLQKLLNKADKTVPIELVPVYPAP